MLNTHVPGTMIYNICMVWYRLLCAHIVAGASSFHTYFFNSKLSSITCNVYILYASPDYVSIQVVYTCKTLLGEKCLMCEHVCVCVCVF